MHPTLLFAATVIALPQGTAPQSYASATPAATMPPAPVRAVAAVRAARPPVIDGRGDDEVWRSAVPIAGFREWQPREDRPARFATEAWIAYDESNLYVLMRALDPSPDSIVRVLARRDSWTASDRMGILIDSYHDRRTAYEFFVNPSGVKVDAAMSHDGREDGAWDAVWDAGTRIDETGWTAEFRIPLSQLRYGTQAERTFGIMLMRDIYRYNERTSWPVLRTSQAGLVHQFGELTGLSGLEAPRRLEASPYLVAANRTNASDFGRSSDVSFGADLKYRVASNLTLDATVNPDFGQVEADPSVFNLTTVESFFGERRPFFVAGSGLFRFTVNCTAVNDCGTGEGLFYSRRIGRTPQLAGRYGAEVDGPARILAAGKLTGRLGSGLTLGVMEAVTERVATRGDTTLEPATNYAVVRLRQDLRQGESSIGGMFTSVNRGLDAWSQTSLHRAAYVGGLELRHRFLNRQYELSAALAASRVEGDPAAIAATQRSFVHLYQRVDGPLTLDTTRTSLAGTSAEIGFGKVSGRHLMFRSDLQHRSAGFEVNDLGYLQRADQTSWSTWVGFFDRDVRRYWRRFQWNGNWWQQWSADGLALERAFNTNMHINLKNYMGLHFGGTVGQLGATYEDRAARGGPAFRQSPFIAPWAGVNGDDRKMFTPSFWVNYYRGDEGRSSRLSLSPELRLRLGTAMTGALAFSWSRNTDHTQWYGNFTDTATNVTSYTFAHLEQRTVSMTARLNYTITPTMSIQLYAAPFITRGSYSDVRALSATPRAERYADRFTAYGDTAVTNDPGGFNFKALQSNAVFRWEYRPGSALFLVWSTGRRGSIGEEGGNSWWRDFRDLTGMHARNTFLVKWSYWINR
jgi:hypothetical protein